MNAARTNLGIATIYYQNFKSNALYFYGVNSQTFFKTYLSEFGFNKQLNKVSTKKLLANQLMKITKGGAVTYVGKIWRASTLLIFMSGWNIANQRDPQYEWRD